MDKTVLDVLNAAFEAIFGTGPDENADKSTGLAFYDHDEEISLVAPGMTPEKITWSQDRGMWMWDGVLVALRAQGVDTSKPVSADMRF